MAVFRAVAELLAYVYRLKASNVRKYDENIVIDEVPIPDDLRRDA